MNYHHFTIEERCCLREYYVKGKSYREIARLLGRNVSSISRELRRNCTFFRDIPRYYPYTAQKKSDLRNSYRHRGMFWKQEVLDYIDEKLSQTWSPEQIANTPCGMKLPSFKTIYRWIDERYLRSTLKKLRRKGKTRKRLGNGGRFTTGKSIRKRDKSVYNRKEFGHWEADTVVSGQGKSKVCFATLAERKTRYYIAIKIPDRKGETMAKAVIEALSQFPKGAVKTITCDRGSEFACWREIEKALHCDMYFADPYCAWQKGTNENLNGLLREFYPKGRNLSRVSPATLKKNLALINARPKKVLHYQTPQDLFEQNLLTCCSSFDNSPPQLFAGILNIRLSRLQPAESKRPFLPHFGGGALLFGYVSPSSQCAVIFFPRPSVVILKYVDLFLSHSPHRKILSFSTVTVSMNSVSTSLSAFPFSFTVSLPSKSRT